MTTHQPTIQCFEAPEQIAQFFWEEVNAFQQSATAPSPQLQLIWPGGSTAELLLKEHPHAEELSRINSWLLDERCVPLSDPESNARQLLQCSPSMKLHHYQFNQEVKNEDAWQQARAYAAHYRAEAERQFTWGIIGVGPDGHIASLFPGHSLESEDLIIYTPRSPKPPPQRVSFSLNAIANFSRLTIITLGSSKADAIAAALERDVSSPLGRLLQLRPDSELLLDTEASAKLKD
ncbi:MAG: 6-phosphogluconolactonase [Polyangiaceae bacterium]|nr:6-phosphogluconolactonase [Polyangiaceae bacterium]